MYNIKFKSKKKVGIKLALFDLLVIMWLALLISKDIPCQLSSEGTTKAILECFNIINI